MGDCATAAHAAETGACTAGQRDPTCTLSHPRSPERSWCTFMRCATAAWVLARS